REGIGEKGAPPKQVGQIIHLAVTEPVSRRIQSIHAFVPRRNLHRHLRKNQRLLPSPAQARAKIEAWLILRQYKVRRSLFVARIYRLMKLSPQHAVQGNALPGVEQMINTR